jgi:uncharacterized protein (DUF1697 family)
VLQDSGFCDVETYIQTGNVFVSTPLRSTAKVEAAMGGALSHQAGFDVVAIVRTPTDLSALLAAVDGIPEEVPDETSRYVSLCLREPAEARVAELHGLRTPGERATVIGKDVLMEFAVPFNEATLTGARLEKILGVPGTARNLTVLRALTQKWGA